MKVCLVNYEENYEINGILSKFAYKMKEELEKLGVKVEVAIKPKKADINHHINYFSYKPSGGIDTLMVTHIWEGPKLDNLREGMKTAFGICMSEEMVDWLGEQGIDKKKLDFVLPAHDQLPRKTINICITTNVYPDGCKREKMFYELLKNIDCSKFHFYIMGYGWMLGGLNANISHIDHFDKEEYIEMLNECEYNLYFGKDEGSMGIVDAKQVGLKTIAPELGFVKGLVDYPFDTQEELNKIFKQLEFNPVEDWTWKKYCESHIKIWEKLNSI